MSSAVAACLALVAHLSLGSVCLMGDARDAMPAMDHGAHASAQHEEGNAGQQSDCQGEHCFAHALPDGSSFSVTSHDALEILPVSVGNVGLPVRFDVPSPQSASPPGQFFHVETIVLRN